MPTDITIFFFAAIISMQADKLAVRNGTAVTVSRAGINDAQTSGSYQQPQGSGAEPEIIGAVYFQDESGRLVPLERPKATQRIGRTGRVYRAGYYYWDISGERSPVRLKGGQKMSFVVRVANGVDPDKFQLIPLDTKKGIRRTRLDPGNRIAPLTLQVNVTKAWESTYGLTPVRELGAGEYCFSPTSSNNSYCFGVDAATASDGIGGKGAAE